MSGIVISMVIAYLYVFLIKTFPKPMTYFMMAASLIVIAGLAVVGIILKETGVWVSFGIIFLVYTLILFCFRNKINSGIAILSIATRFIS